MPIVRNAALFPSAAHDEANGNARDHTLRLGASGQGEMSQPVHAGELSLIQAVLDSSCLGEQRQDTIGDVDSNDL
jgi:hypothetical protein